MKRLLLTLALWVAIAANAQVKTIPSIIEPGYTGQIVITYDPTSGNGGMVGATRCYAHTGIISTAGTWQNVVGSGWRKADEPQLTSTEDGKWQLVIDNMYDFYAVSPTTEIVALAFVFHDGPNGSKEGKTSSGGDIFVVLGQEAKGDIWDDFTPAEVVEQARPEGVSNGIYYGEDGTSVTLCTYAASKTAPAQHVFLLGDMTDWQLSNDYQLKRDGNYFWITLTGLESGQEYRFQYAVIRADGVKKQISDLYSEKVIHPDDQWEPKTTDPNLISYPLTGADGGYVTVIQPGKPEYEWSDATLNFERPDKNNLIIYELWLYDYTVSRNLAGLVKDRLDYLDTLGVNAIELMPVTEFDGNYNWGYSPNHYFALDKAYASPDEFKAFIDECHKRGIAVILDMVFNHATGLNPMNKLYPYGTDLSENPWFNVTAPHSDNVYEDWNHGFAPAHEMFTRALSYWLTEYKVDGFRMDLSHGLCSDVANTSVENLKDYYYSGVQAASPGAYFILEHWGSKMGTERPQLVSEGMLCWNNTNNAYCQAAMGWLNNGDAFTDANKDGYVSYCESHDEERMQYKILKWGNGDLATNFSARLNRVPLCIAFNVLLNGSHMLWQYEEMGYDYSINSDIDHPRAYDESYRCNKKPRCEGYGLSPERLQAYVRSAQIIRLRTKLLPDVFEGDPTATSIGSGKVLRTIQWGQDVFVAGNFGIDESKSVTIPEGIWYNYFEQTALSETTINLEPGELLILTGSPIELPYIDSTVVDVRNIMDDVNAVVRIINGQIVVERNGLLYNMMGQRIR